MGAWKYTNRAYMPFFHAHLRIYTVIPAESCIFVTLQVCGYDLKNDSKQCRQVDGAISFANLVPRLFREVERRSVDHVEHDPMDQSTLSCFLSTNTGPLAAVYALVAHWQIYRARCYQLLCCA